MKYFFPIVFGLILMSSCSTYNEEELEEFDATIQSYLDSTKTKMQRTEDGLYYRIINEGEGERNILYNDKVSFYYTGYFLGGSAFQTIDKQSPISYQVNELIVGWQEALMMIKKGGEVEIIVPPHLGYGDKKTDLIPKNSILRYKLGVVDVQ